MFTLDKAAREAPLHAVSALVIAFVDWLVFGLNIATFMRSYWLIDLSTALAAGGLVTLAQMMRSGDGVWRALLKGAAAAVVVLVPLPIAGTALALVMLTWAWMSAVGREN
jgi:hypothetical protein